MSDIGIPEILVIAVSIRKPRARTPRPARFLFGKEGFSVLARKSRGCAEAYLGTASRSVEID
jgi:hypothetical protein